jgi:hypothetical protein
MSAPKIRRLKRIQDEYDAARAALPLLLAALLRADPSPALAGITRGQVQRTIDGLENTYIVRLFSEFEGCLREYWTDELGRKTEPLISVLMDSIAARRSVDDTTRLEAHQVREYRNLLVHASSPPAPQLTFQEALKRLCKFLSYLPTRP